MTENLPILILPYSLVVGQERLKLALELAFIAPRIGGVLVSGQRGTGKSTIVRAFAQMTYGDLPVTLPINATEDRVIGGWRIDELMRNTNAVWQPGLLVQASELGKKGDLDASGMLYVDEINLLDDHIVNLILDATANGVLVVQREGQDTRTPVSFTLVGTMNPEEGGLRPQLLDRFGLMVAVDAEPEKAKRTAILQTVLNFDRASAQLKRNPDQTPDFIDEARRTDTEYSAVLQQARELLYNIEVPNQVAEWCVQLAEAFHAEGHRGDYTMALAARAYAARDSAINNKKVEAVSVDHVKEVARLALEHRRSTATQGGRVQWSEKDNESLTRILGND